MKQAVFIPNTKFLAKYVVSRLEPMLETLMPVIY
jgi:hypothetical protein